MLILKALNKNVDIFNITFQMKVTNKKQISKIRIVKHSFTGGNITEFSGINIIAKFMNQQEIPQDLGKLFPTTFYKPTKFSTKQILISIIFALLAGINRISRIANFTHDPLVKVNLGLKKADSKIDFTN